MPQQIHERVVDGRIVRQTFISPARNTRQPAEVQTTDSAMGSRPSGSKNQRKTAEKVLETDASPLAITDDGRGSLWPARIMEGRINLFIRL